METTGEISRDAPAMRAGNGRGKIRLLSRSDLDGRTRARRTFDAIAEGIAADLGGLDQLSTVQRHLVEAFAGCAVVLQSINARILKGEPVDLSDQSTAASSLVRIASRIGVARVPRDITDPLSYAKEAEHVDDQ